MKSKKFIVFGSLVAIVALNVIIGSCSGNGNSVSNAKEAVEEEKVEEEKAVEVITISPKELYDAYQKNEIKGDSMYKGKTLQVKGKIHDISVTLGIPTVTMEVELFKDICFNFSESDNDILSDLSKGQTVTIQGECDGMALTTVRLVDCKIIK